MEVGLRGRAAALLGPKFGKSRRKWLYTGATVVVVLGAGVPYAMHKLNAPATPTSTMIYTVGYGDIIRTIQAAGTVQPENTADLTFADATSKVTKINVKVGQTVKQGQLLAQEDDSNTKTALLAAESGVVQAKAALANADASLATAEHGATSAQITTDRQAVQKAQLTLQGAQQAYQSLVSSSAQSSQQQIAAAQAQLANDQQTASDTSNVDAAQAQLTYDQQILAADEQNLKNLQGLYGNITAADVQSAYKTSQTYIGNTHYQQEYQTLSKQYSALQAAQQTIERDQLTVQKDQQALKLAQNSMAKARQQVTVDQQNLTALEQQSGSSVASQQALDNAKLQIAQDKIVLQSAQDQLQQDEQPADAATIATAQAGVVNAQSNLKLAEDKLTAAQQAESQTKLVAPISGVVSQVNGKVGQPAGGIGSSSSAAAGNGPFIEIVANANAGLQVQFQVSEAQIGQIKVGDPVSLSVPAVPGETFKGSVTQIDPTPSTTGSFTQYTAVATVKDPSGSLKVGMNANLQIQTANESHVVTVPAIALEHVGKQEGVYVIGNAGAGAGSTAGASTTGTGSGTTGNAQTSASRGTSGTTGTTNVTGTSAGSTTSGIGGTGNAASGSAPGLPAGAGNGAGRYVGQLTAGSLSNPKTLPSNVHFQPIQAGLVGTSQIAILSGIKPGERILIELPASAAANLNVSGSGAGSSASGSGSGN